MASNNGWQVASLDEYYEFRSGLSKPGSEFGFGHPFLTFKEVFENYFVPEQLSALVNSTESEQWGCSIRRGDVFLTRTSETIEDLGMSCVALKDYGCATFNGFTKRLRPRVDRAIVPEYAAYYFRSPDFRRDVTAMSSLSTRASLNNNMLGRLSILLPPIGIQEAIGRILKSLDDKIELNRQMNATLEGMARALFKSWFVDFDPVTAKAAGNQPFGMSADVATLFPDSFEDSPLGPIPEGWAVSTIGKTVRIMGGSTPSTKEPRFWDGGSIHWCTPRDMSRLADPVVLDTERKITDAGLARISSRLLPAGTVLLSSRAPIGYLAIAEVPLAVNQGFIAMICDQQLPNHYVLRWTEENMDEILSRAGGTTFAEISKTNFRPIPVAVPSGQVLDVFEAKAGHWHEQVVVNVRESAVLAKTRDALLPQLLSGEIRLRDAEKLVEEVA